jgi:hypothetical protein
MRATNISNSLGGCGHDLYGGTQKFDEPQRKPDPCNQCRFGCFARHDGNATPLVAYVNVLW